MQVKKIVALLMLTGATILFAQCTKDDKPVITNNNPQPDLPAIPFDYLDTYPAYMQTAMQLNDNTPADNPITNKGATLGRVLFYDKQLSQNNTISCGSCHKPSVSYSDDAVFSLGFAGGLTSRASMQLINVRYYRSGKMFWDERAETLEEQVLQPIQNHVEMGLTIPELVSKVSAQNYYPVLFQNAFGSTTIDSSRIAKALAQFIRSIVPYQSKFDRVRQGQDVFTAAEQAGEQLFFNAGPPGAPRCAGCHTPPLFITSTPVAPFGLLDPNDHGINNTNHFKSGSLRNIALTAPYFHNGSVPTLQAMLASNIPAHGVPPQDVQNILAFLQTLNDPSINTEPKFSDPF